MRQKKKRKKLKAKMGKSVQQPAKRQEMMMTTKIKSMGYKRAVFMIIGVEVKEASRTALEQSKKTHKARPR